MRLSLSSAAPFAIAALFCVVSALVAPASPSAAETEDPRTPVTLPDDMQAAFLQHMRDHMMSFDTVMAELAAGDFPGAAQAARDELVVGSGEGFGRYLPLDFREMGLAMHRAAADFADVAEAASDPPTAEDWRKAIEALQVVSSQCSSCHAVFRVK